MIIFMDSSKMEMSPLCPHSNQSAEARLSRAAYRSGCVLGVRIKASRSNRTDSSKSAMSLFGLNRVGSGSAVAKTVSEMSVTQYSLN
jgi:hypothetical protein